MKNQSSTTRSLVKCQLLLLVIAGLTESRSCVSLSHVPITLHATSPRDQISESEVQFLLNVYYLYIIIKLKKKHIYNRRTRDFEDSGGKTIRVT